LRQLVPLARELTTKEHKHMKARLAIGLAAVLVLALPLAANAALPSASSTLIVPNKSIGGVKLASSLALATAAWGKGGTCGASGCSYTAAQGRGGTASFLVAATVTGGPEKVVSIAVEAGLLGNSGKRNFNTPISRFKTANGIGVGSTVSQLRHAYPHLTKRAANYYVIPGPGITFTGFGILEGRVENIKMQDVQLG
jgi:hypothetical protein